MRLSRKTVGLAGLPHDTMVLQIGASGGAYKGA
jgi:hypothetical protein